MLNAFCHSQYGAIGCVEMLLEVDLGLVHL